MAVCRLITNSNLVDCATGAPAPFLERRKTPRDGSRARGLR
jgi:hypothetical protein